ncbi:MAG: 50S ribosomal protein L15 [Defluviitoga tunisiensis]|jgi:large subunit ribosomal protein L15|uniref:Large ribosomal subunit protein uL15 n=1 Tax=Defluviitoga tunisiensis TaxID=1006576 RepID=A0A0C7NNK0_DEFTU|nr:50S ribosomal protein L15 [Defluviitoga tunisiensis]MDD3600713.1 50S ribosomal protein L15 [Defluviitoga tunisiensis]MDY0379208.1 50S ribosomal protein L15 [Defluviitoga tunisiensis]CEP77507.1 50S ribosomal protein L15 [Defluviitoga tunisiensis]HHV01256.1 50S ribosomal protein L15 [Defluviitoga tunisiensis]HOB55148.1 50S ribosomal protein L15 [Defluviitoga tunisiensis]
MSLKIEDLKPSEGSNKPKKRLGRGTGSGHGKTSGKGHKGEKARGKGKISKVFEGGQTNIIRRTPKYGFSNAPFKKEYSIVNVSTLEKYFSENEEVTPEILIDKKIIKTINDGIKILGKGEITKPLVVKAHQFSENAKEKIEAAGGKIEVIK